MNERSHRKTSYIGEPQFWQRILLIHLAFDLSYAAIITQKNDDGNEVPISYMSYNLQGAKLNYPDVEKQGFAGFKAIKHFRPYLLKAKTKVIILHHVVRALFVQKEMGEQRENWITALQEFDLEIKPTNIVRGQGLCRLAAEALVDIEGVSEAQKHSA